MDHRLHMVALENLDGLTCKLRLQCLTGQNSTRGMADNQCAVVYYQGKLDTQSLRHSLRATIAPGRRQRNDNARLLSRSNGRARARCDLALRGKERAIYIDRN